MKMTRFSKYISAILIASICVVSCDSLDEPLEQQDILDDTDYTQTGNMLQLLTGAYSTLYNLQWETFPLVSVRGDDVNASGDQEPLHKTDSLQYDRNFWMYNSVWLNYYSDIVSFHASIEEIEKYKEFADNPAIADQYIAEIKVMRAYELFMLTRLWGPILIPSSSLTDELYSKPVSSQSEVLQHISDEMDAVMDDLPSVRPNERTDIPGGITRYTALAVKALANLEMKNFEAVADATGEIINDGGFALESNYYELFKIPGKLSNENILELQYSDFGQGSGQEINYLNQFFGPPGSGWGPVVSGAGPGWGFWEPSVKYVKFMLDRGEQERLETTVLFTPAGIAEIQSDPEFATLPGWVSNITRDEDTLKNNARLRFVSGKHYLPSNQLTPGRTTYGTNKNFICIRYAEILLMYAEAVVQGGSEQGISADAAVNQVRSRAGFGTPLSGVTLDDILDEKFAEFGMEWGIRFYDLARYDMTSELNSDGIEFNAGERFLPYPLSQQDLLPQLRDQEQ